MDKQQIQQYKIRLEEILDEAFLDKEGFDKEALEEEVLGILNEINGELDYLKWAKQEYWEKHDFTEKTPFDAIEKELKKLLPLIEQIKKDYDFYDEEGVIDMMFPNRHDDDFDEDDISYRHVFGDD